MHILVTGSAGFVGSFMVQKLVAAGHRVTGIDNLNHYYDPKLKYDRLQAAGIVTPAYELNKAYTSSTHPNYQFYNMQLEDATQLKQLFADFKFDKVCHLAAQAGVRYSLEAPQAYIDSNITGFLNILECCRHHPVEHLCYASSSSVYGMNTKIPFATTDNVDQPVSLYAATKKSNELMAHTYSHLFGIPTTGLRFFTVYGPWGRPDMAYFSFTQAILAGRPIPVFNHGDLKRDFTYIDDIVEGVCKILDCPPSSTSNLEKPQAPYQLFNIGNNQPVQLLEFIQTIESALGKKAILDLKPMQPGDVYQTYADIDDLKTKIGYQPTTTIQVGLQKFVQWYKDYYGV